MSALHVYVLCCDAPGCGVRFTRDLLRADQTRQVAASEGWLHGVVPPNPHRGGPTPSRDYCPAHVALGEGLRSKALPEHARPVVEEAPR